MLYFITGNKNKLAEIQAIIPGVEQLDIDLPEIQEIDAHAIIKAKLLEALNHHPGEFMVEDTSLYLDCLNGLPGPLIKWFIKSIGLEGLYNLTEKLGDNKAQAKTLIGYAKSREELYFFEGIINGTIVKPDGPTTFGWDPIFKPNGHSQTFAMMDQAEKNSLSMRAMAAHQLKDHLKF